MTENRLLNFIRIYFFRIFFHKYNKEEKPVNILFPRLIKRTRERGNEEEET